MRGHDIESVDVGGVDIFANILLADHRFVDRRFDFADIYTDAARSVGLRVAVHEEYLFLKRGERGGKIDRSGRFPHPAFLVGDCDDFSHSDSLCPMLVRIGSCGKGKKKKVFHDVPRHFFTAHAFIIRLRSPLPPHSPHTLSNADCNSLAFSLAQDISTRSFAPARQHSARSCRLSFSTHRHGKKNKPCFGRNSSTSRPILPTFHTPKPTSFVPLAPSHTRIRALHRFSTLPSPCRRNPFKTLTNRLLQVKPSPFSPSHPNNDNSFTTNYLR